MGTASWLGNSCLSITSEVVGCVMRVSKGNGRFSARILQDSILDFYVVQKLLPSGMLPEMECVQVWALKMGLALQRLVPWALYVLICFLA